MQRWTCRQSSCSLHTCHRDNDSKARAAPHTAADVEAIVALHVACDQLNVLHSMAAPSKVSAASVAAIDQLSVLIEDDSANGNPTLQLIAGYIYSYEQEYDKALKAVHNGYTLEQYAPHRVPLALFSCVYLDEAANVMCVVPCVGWLCTSKFCSRWTS